MITRSAPIVVLLCLAGPLGAVAHADDALGARALVQRPLAGNEEDPSASATTLQVKNRPMAIETLREVLPEVPGALPIANGGYGSFSSVSLRGSDLAQTIWLLGDVPLNGPETGAFDISLIPVSQVDSLEVYRGGAPLWLSQGSIGGVVRVVPRESEGTGGAAEFGVGSYGLFELRGSGYVRSRSKRDLRLYSGIQATSSDGNFRYVDDRGTRSDSSDDVERRLHNAQVQDGAGLFHLRVGLGRGHLDSIFYGFERNAGVPGAGGARNARYARRNLRRGLFTTAYTLERRHHHRVQVLASAQAEDKQVDDRFAELGLGGPRSLHQTWWRGYGRAAASLTPLPFVEMTSTLSYASDHFDEQDKLRPDSVGPSSRMTEALAGELRLFGRVIGLRSELRGSLRGEWSQSAVSSLQVARVIRDEQALFSSVYRLAAASEPTPGLTLRGSLGSGRRIPAINELFGDGGTLKPNPRLGPERGRYTDLGFAFAGAFHEVCTTIEANGFVQQVDDRIALVTTNQFQSIAINLGTTRIRGVELGVDAGYRRTLRLVGSMTLLQTSAEHGLQLPRQPKLRLYGRAEGSLFSLGPLDRVTFFTTVDHVSTAYFDTANESLRTPITHMGLGAAFALLRERLELSTRVADLLDARGQDYQRFPLPGRFFALAINIREEQL